LCLCCFGILSFSIHSVTYSFRTAFTVLPLS
jgi:hypothetical protein